jgi:hypothetical protein
LALLASLPVLGRWARHRAGGCALDGMRVEPWYRVRVMGGGGQRWEFCCVACAEHWLARQRPPQYQVTVTDEPTGTEVWATDAYFVRSTVVTNPTTGNRIHAFRTRADARRHIEQAKGTLLTEADRPLVPRGAR